METEGKLPLLLYDDELRGGCVDPVPYELLLLYDDDVLRLLSESDTVVDELPDADEPRVCDGVPAAELRFCDEELAVSFVLRPLKGGFSGAAVSVPNTC